MIALLLAAAVATGAEHDRQLREAMELVYDGSTETAIRRLAEITAARPDDPLGWYFEALALCWRIEQQPQSEALDPSFHERVDRAIEVAEERLERDPEDSRACLALGAAYGVRSRLHLFRRQRFAAARAAARMRKHLLRVQELDAECQDVWFGLGLYDYYAATLPGAAKLLRFLMGMPGGDRERGLRRIARARHGTLFHDTEVQAQLAEIFAEFEGQPDQALEDLLQLRARYPGAPLWGLKLARLLGQLGDYARGAQVAQELITSSETGHPNHTPIVADMARVALGESLVHSLQTEAVSRELEPLTSRPVAEPWIRGTAELLLGRSLELEGDREAAVSHYEQARRSADAGVRGRAREALASPIPAAQVRAVPHLRHGRQLWREGRRPEAAVAYRSALAAWPRCQEALLAVAEELIRHGEIEWPRRAVEHVMASKEATPPWVRPWSRLLRGWLHDLDGQRSEALELYKDVLKAPSGRRDLHDEAAQRIERPYATGNTPPAFTSDSHQ